MLFWASYITMIASGRADKCRKLSGADLALIARA